MSNAAMNPERLLEQMKSGEKVTLPVLLKTMGEELDEYHAVWSQGRPKKEVLLEAISRRSKDRREGTIQLLEEVVEQTKAKRLDEFWKRDEMVFDDKALNYTLFCLPYWAVLSSSREDELFHDVCRKTGARDSRWWFKKKGWNGSWFHPLSMCAVDYLRDGTHKTVTCKEAMFDVFCCTLSMATDDDFGDYCEGVGIPGFPVVYTDENPPIQHDMMWTPKK